MFDSNYDIEEALQRVPTVIAKNLVVWTAQEQQAIGTAFDKVSMQGSVLRAAVLLHVHSFGTFATIAVSTFVSSLHCYPFSTVRYDQAHPEKRSAREEL